MASTEDKTKDFIRQRLPWAVALGALALYLVTLNHWVTLSSLPTVAQVTGWDWWTVKLQAPVHYLLTYPLRWVAPASQPLALNIFSAVCAALTLGLLARSVALLPQDRTREQREKGRSESGPTAIPAGWLPPLLAVFTLALQLTFWEHATAHTGEVLNLLLFACVIRDLLEFRASRKESWLRRAAFVFGLGLTNDWAMLAYLPLFTFAVIWMLGTDFFDLRRIGRLLGFGALGLLPYLVMPMVDQSSPVPAMTFWDAFRLQFSLQKNAVLSIPLYMVCILSLSSLVPIVIVSIRWPSSFGDTSVLGGILTTVMFYFVNGMFLIVCTWLAFDPVFSPRQLGFGLPFLSLHYLAALTVGYCAAYFLVICLTKTDKAWRRPGPLRKAFNGLAIAAVFAGVVAVPAGLLWRNYPVIQSRNGPALQKYAQQLSAELPAGGAVLLSDNPLLLLLVEGEQARVKQPTRHVAVDLNSITLATMHRKLQHRYGPRWPTFNQNALIPDQLPMPTVTTLLIGVAQKQPVYLLHPGLGFQFLEGLQPEPAGLVFLLKPLRGTPPQAEPLGAESIQRNSDFWSGIASANSAGSSAQSSEDEQSVKRWYSRGIDQWGTELQRLGRVKEAEAQFKSALSVNPSNVVAQVNLAVNAWLQQGAKPPLPDFNKGVEVQLKNYRSWSQLLDDNGPFDEPRSSHQLGMTFSQLSLHHQAAAQFQRAAQLDPTDPTHTLGQADAYLALSQGDLAMATVQTLQSRRTNDFIDVGLTRIEATAQFQKKDLPGAEKILNEARKRHPKDINLLDTLFQINLVSGNQTNALAALEAQYAIAPTTMRTLINLGNLHTQMGHPEKAIPYLNESLKHSPNNTAGLYNRGMAYLASKQLDLAEKDFITLQKAAPQSGGADYGLGEVAYARGDKSAALKFYRRYQNHTATAGAEVAMVAARIRELQGGK